MTDRPSLHPAAAEVTRLLDGVTASHLDGPTPCPAYPVAALLDHLMGLTLAFTWGARKAAPDDGTVDLSAPPSPTADHLDPQWRERLPEQLTALADAWADPSAWDGMTMVGGATLPGEIMGLVALDEVVLHGWDLAVATGQEFRCDPVSTEVVLGFTERSAQPGEEASRQGIFGPVVPVAADAPPLHRALGFAGRDPAWTPDPLPGAGFP
jgi:uncharacterized protein (TIGR03086 family)